LSPVTYNIIVGYNASVMKSFMHYLPRHGPIAAGKPLKLCAFASTLSLMDL
jgi:hypothetical protein